MDLDGQSWETPTAREMLVNWVSQISLPDALCGLHSRQAGTVPGYEACTSLVQFGSVCSILHVASGQPVRLSIGAGVPIAPVRSGQPIVGSGRTVCRAR